MHVPGADGLPWGEANPKAAIEADSASREVRARAARSTPPAALSANPTVSGLLVALRRRWLLALSLALLLGPTVGFGVWVLRPITYAARTLVHVNSIPPRFLFEVQEGKGDFTNY